MASLVHFLRARLDEDEMGVRALTVPHEWHTGPGDDPDWTDEELVCMWPPEFHTPFEQDKHWRGLTVSGPELAAHIARYDPARALRAIEAKRRTVDEYANNSPLSFEEWPLFPLMNMVREYSDRGDFKAEWAPDLF